MSPPERSPSTVPDHSAVLSAPSAKPWCSSGVVATTSACDALIVPEKHETTARTTISQTGVGATIISGMVRPFRK